MNDYYKLHLKIINKKINKCKKLLNKINYINNKLKLDSNDKFIKNIKNIENSIDNHNKILFLRNLKNGYNTMKGGSIKIYSRPEKCFFFVN